MPTTQSRIIHRRLTIVAFLPLLMTLITGSIYSLLILLDIDAIWILKMHTGNFLILNLQPFYSPVIGISSILALISGLFLFPKSKKT